MNMNDYRRIPTTPEVWAVIRARHTELVPFGSYSAPDGDQFGNPDQGVMFTSYGFRCGDFPIIEAETTWDIDRDRPNERVNQSTRYWLCVPVEEDD